MPGSRFPQAGLTALAALALFAARPADAQLSLHYEELLPFPAGDGSYAASISANGTIVGSYADSKDIARGYIRSPTGTFTTFNAPGTPGTGFLPGTYLTGVNNAGDLTGNFGDYNTNTYDFIYHNGFLSPTVAGAAYTGFNGVNEAGQVATYYLDAAGHSHGATYDIATGAFTLLPDVPGYTDGSAVRILSDGTVLRNLGVIDLVTGDEYYRGSLTLNNVTTFFDVPVPGALDTHLDDVTSTGLYVGHYLDANQVRHGFIYDSVGKNFYSIDVPGATATDLKAGNSANQFVGDWFDANGEHSLLVTATPAVPEPGSVALLVGLSVTGAGFLRRRKTRKIRA